MPKYLRKILPAAACLLWTLSGCQTMNVPSPHTGAPPAQSSVEVYAHQLSQLDAPELGKRLAKAHAAWTKDKSAANRARLGLIRGQRGYSGYAPEQAVQDLRDAALQSGAAWSPSERAFLQFQATQLAHIHELEAQASAAASQTSQLKQELQQEKEKLQAIGEIERDINRQKP